MRKKKKRKASVGRSIRTSLAKGAFFLKIPLDHKLLMAALLLNIYGVIMIYSSSYYAAANTLDYGEAYFLMNQFRFVVLGFGALLLFSCIDYHVWIRMGFFCLVLSFGVIFALLIPGIGVTRLGATRWINLGVASFQAVEPAKLGMIIFYAYYVAKFGVNNKEQIIVAFGIALLMAIVVAGISDNVSTAIIMFGMCYLILLVSAKKFRNYLLAAVVALVLVVLGCLLFTYVVPYSESENFRITRIRAWIDPVTYGADEAFQAQQSLYAIGAGGLFGKGLGQSLVKFKLPEPYNDFILAILFEELGLFGFFLLIFLFGCLLYRLYRIAMNAIDISGRMLALGLFFQIVLQLFLNIMVVTSLFPTTGVTLPFFSAGGSSAFFLLIEIGIVMNVDKLSKAESFRKKALQKVAEEEKKGPVKRKKRPLVVPGGR